MPTEQNYLNEDYKTAAEKGLVAPSIFGHAAIKTSRFEEMIEWYVTVLNAEIMFRSPLICFLSYDTEHHRIALVNAPGLNDPTPDIAGVDHLSFTYRDIDELMSTYYRLQGKGIVPFWTILHGPTLSMYFKDPDGGNIELQIDAFESVDDLMDWFKTGTYDENPIGIKVDIEKLFEKYRSGTPLKELLKRRSLQPGESFMEHLVM